MTNDASIHVVGRVDDPDGDLIESVALATGGLEMALVGEGGGFWRADDVPLSAGANEIVVTATDMAGAASEGLRLRVASQAVFTQPGAVLFDPAADRLFVLDRGQRAINVVDPETGSAMPLSDHRRGAGPPFELPVDMVAGPAGTLLVADGRRILQVDTVTGDRTVLLVNDLDPLAPGAAFLAALAYDADRETLYLLPREDRLLQVDLRQSPLRVSEVGSGSGASASFLDAVFANGEVFAIRASDRTVRAFDVSSGDSRVLAEWAVDEPAFTALDYEVVTNSLMLIGGSLSRYVLDQATLEPVTTSIPPGAGFGLAVTGNVAYAVSLLGKEVLEIDLDSAASRPVANAGVAAGPVFSSLSGGAYDRDRNRLLLSSFESLGSYDIASATREILLRWEPAPASAFQPVSAAALSFPGGDVLWVSDASAQRLREVNLTAATVREVSGPGVGSGPAFTRITGLAVDRAGAVAYVGDAGFTQRILRVDLASGDRTIFHELDDSSDIEVRGVLLDEEGDRLILGLAADTGNEIRIAALDLTTRILQTVSSFQPLGDPEPFVVGVGGQLSGRGDEIITLLPSGVGAAIGAASLDGQPGIVISHPMDPGPQLFLPVALITASRQRLFVVDAVGTIHVVDEASGARAVISQ